uniref:Uncharacterized protein n=1 Tax=Anguilla anguilla TaxID=7936 RepID=A0A0E9U5N7_ANGAN
MSDTCVTE